MEAEQGVDTISEHKPGKAITHVMEPINIPRALNTGIRIDEQSAHHILWTHRRTGVSHSQHRKNSRELLEKRQVNGPEGYKLVRKKSLAVGVACMATHGPAPGLKRENL